MIALALFLSVFIGATLGFFLRQKKSIANLMLTASGAFLLSITILHLLPESYSKIQSTAGIWILVGVLIQLGLEYLSKGAEHGHLHFHGKKFPVLVIVGLFLHAFIEGIPLHEGNDNSLIIGIIAHKIPVATLIYLAISDHFQSISKQILFLALFALASPLGFWLGNIPFLMQYEPEIMALVGGIFLHISTTIIFESSNNHSFNLKKLLMLIIGIGLGFFTLH